MNITGHFVMSVIKWETGVDWQFQTVLTKTHPLVWILEERKRREGLSKEDYLVINFWEVGPSIYDGLVQAGIRESVIPLEETRP